MHAQCLYGLVRRHRVPVTENTSQIEDIQEITIHSLLHKALARAAAFNESTQRGFNEVLSMFEGPQDEISDSNFSPGERARPIYLYLRSLVSLVFICSYVHKETSTRFEAQGLGGFAGPCAQGVLEPLMIPCPMSPGCAGLIFFRTPSKSVRLRYG